MARWIIPLVFTALLAAPSACVKDGGSSASPQTLPETAEFVAPANEPCQGEETEQGPTYLVTRVIDGDTIEVEQGEERIKVRLLCIDTPERGEDGFDEATAALAGIFGEARRVQLVYDPEHDERDRFGRHLCYVIADGVNANVEMVKLGHTRYWTKYGRSSLYEAEFLEADPIR